MAGRLAVVGAGLMGSGIAQVAAQAGWDVTMRDVTPEALARGYEAIRGSLDRFVAKGTVTAEDAEAAQGRIRTTGELDAAVDELGELLKKYVSLLEAVWLAEVAPVHQEPWERAFTVAWKKD